MAKGPKPKFINYYRHDECGERWVSTWDCGCDEPCPTCDAPITPYKSVPVEEAEAGDEPIGSPTEASIAEQIANNPAFWSSLNEVEKCVVRSILGSEQNATEPLPTAADVFRAIERRYVDQVLKPSERMRLMTQAMIASNPGIYPLMAQILSPWVQPPAAPEETPEADEPAVVIRLDGGELREVTATPGVTIKIRQYAVSEQTATGRDERGFYRETIHQPQEVHP